MKCLQAVVLTLLCSGAASAQNLVFNGGFENPSVGAAEVQFFSGTTLGGWTSTGGLFGGSGYITSNFNYNFGTLQGPLSYEGSQYLYLNNAAQAGVVLSQTLSLVAGTPYTLSFAQAGIGTLGAGAVNVSVGSFLSQSFAAAGNDWQVRSVNFTPSASGLATLSFTSQGGAVTLDAVAVSAVPEPEVAQLLALGLLLVGHVARRRAKVT